MTDSDGSPGALSRLLAEMASSPERDPRAWQEGLAAGTVVDGRFELVRELGRGGFGVVFEARDTVLRRGIAFKALCPRARPRSAHEEELLRREADAIVLLQHRNIVTLHDTGRSKDGRYQGPYLIFELLEGETLAHRLRRGPLPVVEAVRIAAEVARALVHAHARGVLHRDLKPSNVFLAGDSSVKVLDFGLAHVWGVGGPVGSGTPGYMAPEQQRGEPEDERADLYALGVTLHEMLTAARPAAAGQDPQRPRRRGVPRALADLVARLTDPDPHGRPSSAAAVVHALEGVNARRKRRIALALVGSTAAATTAAAMIGYHALRERPAPAEYYVWLERAQDCAARPVFGHDCSERFRKAIAVDGTRPEAHLGFAVWERWYGGSLALQRSEIEAAERTAAHASPRDALLIRGWSAHIRGRDDDALATFRRVAARWPDDRRALYEIGDLLRHRDELDEAVPALERVAALDPDYGWAAASLAEALGALGRTDALRAWSARWEAAGTPAALHGLSLARGWLGDIRGADEAARRGAEMGGAQAAQQDRLAAAVFAGAYAAAEETVRPLTHPASPVRRMGFYALAALEAYQGRRQAGLAQLDALHRAIPEVADDVLYHGVRADYLLGDRDAAGVWGEAQALRALDPRAASDLAPSLAWLGDSDHAALLARDLRPGSVLAETYEALAAWNRGEQDAAVARLRAVSDRIPMTVWRVAPLWLYGDLAARVGRDDEAVRAFERFERLYLPRVMWRSWAHGEALLQLARSYERLGDRTRARAAADRLVAEWAHGDAMNPRVTAARALRGRLAR